MTDRFEIKYVIDRPTADILLERASHWMRPDPHMGAKPRYTVRSLYFDTANLKHFREVSEGQCVKRKFRLRRYDINSDEVFFEVKSRYNRTVVKDRRRTLLGRARDFLRNPFTEAPGVATAAHAPELAREPHGPIVTVCYDRIALEGLLGTGVRVTLDDNIRCGHEDLFGRPLGLDDPRVLPPGLTVLELKFDSKLPSWLAQAVVDLELTARDYSKYCNSIRRLHGGSPLITEIVNG